MQLLSILEDHSSTHQIGFFFFFLIFLIYFFLFLFVKIFFNKFKYKIIKILNIKKKNFFFPISFNMKRKKNEREYLPGRFWQLVKKSFLGFRL